MLTGDSAPPPLKVFLASPGDLFEERLAVKAIVDEHNRRESRGSGSQYEIVGWETVPGTARRAQAAINVLIDSSHFMIVLFKGRWGTKPGSPWGYTSGTEEEFFTGLMELNRSDSLMRDVWVAFFDTEAPDYQVQALKNEIIQSNSLMFESIDGITDLRRKLTQRLVHWSESPSVKIPRSIELLPSSGKDVLRATKLRIRGEELIELGQPAAGRSALEAAACIGGPLERLAFAKMLRRTGELEEAYHQAQAAIDFYAEGDTLHSVAAAEAFSAQARVMSAQGKTYDSIGRLERALVLLVQDDEIAQGARCRILDDLGLAYQGTGNMLSAREKFQESLRQREAMGVASDIAQSWINIARLEVGCENLEAAAKYADRAIELIRSEPAMNLHGNANVLLAQVRLRQGQGIDGISHGKAALAANRQVDNKRGEAISLLVLGQCYRSAGQIEDARRCLRECIEVNLAMGCVAGAERARWQLAQLPSPN